ncbi:MAG: hypothetical protein PIR02_15925 [Microbacterium enclense]
MRRAPAPGFSARILDIDYTGRRLDYTTGWFVTGISGITDGASVTSREMPRDRQEGQLDLPNDVNDPRIIELKGIVYAGSAAELERLQWKAGAFLVAPESSAEFHWRTRAGTALSTHVRRGRGWEFRPTPSPRRANFLHRYRAPSQLIRGEMTIPVVGTEILVENSGEAPSPAIITVTGTMPGGYEIRGPYGRVYQVTSSPGPGPDVIDMDNDGLLLRGGVVATGVYGARIDVWDMPKGHTPLSLVPVSGAGQMSVQLRPGYY